jgi:hypothetical protein
MSLFSRFWRKHNDLATEALDDELRKVVPAPPPQKMYRYTIQIEDEAFTSAPMTKMQAIQNANSCMVYGTSLIQGGELCRWIPPHRIYEITFEEVGENDSRTGEDDL